MIQRIFKGLLAGILIGLGAYGYVVCRSQDMTWLGYLLFSLGLVSVFFLQAHLFTGKIGQIHQHNIGHLILMLMLNYLGISVIAVCAAQNPILSQAAVEIVEMKVKTPWFLSLFGSIFCGMIIQLAVELKEAKTIWTTVLCVVLFMACGWDHCVANLFYWVCAGFMTWSWWAVVLFIIYIGGNSLGAIGMYWLIKGVKHE